MIDRTPEIWPGNLPTTTLEPLPTEKVPLLNIQVLIRS